MANAAREQWRSRWGFILAAVGSAVGLGNMWRFSYLTAEMGGAAFVGLYILFTFLIGMPAMLAELTLGRGSRSGPIEALEHFGGRSWRALGIVFVAAGFLILSYYGVIGGWTLRYAAEALVVGYASNPGNHFTELATGFDSLATQILFMALTVAVVSGGVGNGIERLARVAMPALFVIIVGIALYASTLEGSDRGYAYYLNFDLENALSLDVIVAAAGQAFFRPAGFSGQIHGFTASASYAGAGRPTSGHNGCAGFLRHFHDDAAVVH